MKGTTMRIVLAALILAAALFSATAVGIFAATVAEKDHATHIIIGEPAGSPLAFAAYAGERLAL
jgi:hypothetical protein